MVRRIGMSRSYIFATGAVLLVACGGSEDSESGPKPDASADSGSQDARADAGSSGTGGSSGGASGAGGDSGAAGSSASGGTGGAAGAAGVSGGSGAAGDSGDASGGAPPDGGDSGTTVIDDCPGSLDPATVSALRAGGSVLAATKWLYPYELTVFPRGILAPVLQWASQSGPSVDGVYLQLRTSSFEYRGCFGSTNPLRIELPANAWTAATGATSGPGDPIVVELTSISSGLVVGPISQKWIVAPAALPGLVYYSTYGSPQAANNGAIMRLRPGDPRPEPYLVVSGIPPLGPCVGCHAVSANGQRMVAATHYYPAGPYTSSFYAVTTSATPSGLTQDLQAAEFAAVFPDGSRFLTSGSPGTTTAFPFPNGPGNVAGMLGPVDSRMYTASGQPITLAGFNVQHAKMPAFSRDGRHLVFNNHAATNGHSLSTSDFDPATSTFSNIDTIFDHATLYPGWPTYTPDASGIVFALGDASDYVSAQPARAGVARSDLYYVDVPTKTVVPLSNAGGFYGGNSYLPYPGRDEHYDFFPSVAPVASGGYYWVFFTSRRNYGNTIVGAVEASNAKSIWVAAIDMNAPAGTDPSHAAFYLAGQEPGAGNWRPVPVPDP